MGEYSSGGQADGEFGFEGGELAGGGGEGAGGGKQFLDGEPVEVAAGVPGGEVLGFDGGAVEMFVEDGLDFGEPIEPFNEVHAGFAVVEALVEFFAERAGEAGDFAGAFHEIMGLGVDLKLRKHPTTNSPCGRPPRPTSNDGRRGARAGVRQV